MHDIGGNRVVIKDLFVDWTFRNSVICATCLAAIVQFVVYLLYDEYALRLWHIYEINNEFETIRQQHLKIIHFKEIHVRDNVRWPPS